MPSEMESDLIRQSAATLAEAIAAGEVSAREVAIAHLDRIAEIDDRVHAFLHVDRDGALAAADAVDQARARGEDLPLLAGVPIAVKDEIGRAHV